MRAHLTSAALGMLVALAVAAGARGAPPRAPAANATMFAEQIVFLYYADLQVADAFFANALGLAKTMDADWVKIYRTGTGSYVGAVKEGRGFHATSPSKPVMVTWTVEDIDGWYARAITAGVKILREPRESKDPPARTFLVADSTGYTFEFLQWKQK